MVARALVQRNGNLMCSGQGSTLQLAQLTLEMVGHPNKGISELAMEFWDELEFVDMDKRHESLRAPIFQVLLEVLHEVRVEQATAKAAHTKYLNEKYTLIWQLMDILAQRAEEQRQQRLKMENARVLILDLMVPICHLSATYLTTVCDIYLTHVGH